MCVCGGGKVWSMGYLIIIHCTCFSVNFFPTVSRTTLKKHLTLSVVLERGCSTGIRLKPLRHCLVSISAAKAMSVSLVNPLTSLSGLKIIFKCQVSLSMLCGINTD